MLSSFVFLYGFCLCRSLSFSLFLFILDCKGECNLLYHFSVCLRMLYVFHQFLSMMCATVFRRIHKHKHINIHTQNIVYLTARDHKAKLTNEESKLSRTLCHSVIIRRTTRFYVQLGVNININDTFYCPGSCSFTVSRQCMNMSIRTESIKYEYACFVSDSLFVLFIVAETK